MRFMSLGKTLLRIYIYYQSTVTKDNYSDCESIPTRMAL